METIEKKPWTAPTIEYYETLEYTEKCIEALQQKIMVYGDKLFDDPDNEELKEILRVYFDELVRYQGKYKKLLRISNLLKHKANNHDN